MCVPLGIHLEPLNKQLMLLVKINNCTCVCIQRDVGMQCSVVIVCVRVKQLLNITIGTCSMSTDSPYGCFPWGSMFVSHVYMCCIRSLGSCVIPRDLVY